MRTKVRGTVGEAHLLAGEITTVLGRAWGGIREWHPDLPSAVVILASGSGRRARWGHWAASRWDIDGDVAGEVMVAGELMGPDGGNDPDLPTERKVLGTLLHEGAHALCHALRIKDTSRGGRYHNAQFRDVAEDVGLEVLRTASHGWSHTRITEATAMRYAETLDDLAEVLNGYREGGNLTSGNARPPRSRWIRAACSCRTPRAIRVSRSTLDAAPIMCVTCEKPFDGGA